jgi:cytochrome c peroxidase
MTRLEDAVRHHLDVFDSARNYDPKKAGGDKDLRYRHGPIEPVLARVDPLLRTPIRLTGGEFEALVAFVRDALLDERAARRNLCPLIPDAVPSGYSTMIFEECH